MPPISYLLLYCRAGFENECAAEITDLAQALGVSGYCKTKPDSAYLTFVPHDEGQAGLLRPLRLDQLTFARQLVFGIEFINALPITDRLQRLVPAIKQAAAGYGDLRLETADTNAAKELSVFCRKFAGPLRQALAQRGIPLAEPAGVNLHLFFLSSSAVHLGWSDPDTASPWPMGIPRLKFPFGAPSRSTLKLEEAFLTFLSEQQRAAILRPGMRAVDLGAAPGGWTWQLVQRGLRVTAVDNGAMAPALMESGLVEHLRVDGFRYTPAQPVDWMVCDMVEQPSRIAALVARWLSEGHCAHSIFNLKLPMKKRYEELKRCRAVIETALAHTPLAGRLRFKQLYHDREEVTGYVGA